MVTRENSPELLMEFSSAIAVTPARHDNRTRDDPSARLLGPAHAVQKALGAIRLPSRQQQVCLRGQRVEYFSAEKSMLAILGFKIAVVPKTTSLNLSRQSLA